MGTSKIQGELWGKAPRDWAEIQEPQHRPLFEDMLNAAEVGPGTRFLDAGCGGGGASVLAAERGAKVSGLDAAEGLITFARERVSNGDFRVGDIESLPFEDEAFDAVFAANSVQYSEDRIAALRELGRVSTPEGRIVAGLFGSPEKVEFRAIFKAVRDAMPEPPPGGGPFELSAPGKLEDLFEEAGLKVLESGEADCPYNYSSFEMFWRASVAAGPFQGMLRIISEEKLKSALRDAVEAFRLDNGGILIQPNAFKYVVANRQ
jgi:SAM-dependent methyltransferase